MTLYENKTTCRTAGRMSTINDVGCIEKARFGLPVIDGDVECIAVGTEGEAGAVVGPTPAGAFKVYHGTTEPPNLPVTVVPPCMITLRQVPSPSAPNVHVVVPSSMITVEAPSSNVPVRKFAGASHTTKGGCIRTGNDVVDTSSGCRRGPVALNKCGNRFLFHVSGQPVRASVASRHGYGQEVRYRYYGIPGRLGLSDSVQCLGLGWNIV